MRFLLCHSVVILVAGNILTDAVKIVHQVYPSVAVTDSDVNDEIIDLAVSFDCSWMTHLCVFSIQMTTSVLHS